jgi:hypothetical protein
MRACRKRQSAGIALFYVAADETTYEMMKRFGGLDPNKVEDKQAVRAALGRLLRAGLKALLEREAAHRREIFRDMSRQRDSRRGTLRYG